MGTVGVVGDVRHNDGLRDDEPAMDVEHAAWAFAAGPLRGQSQRPAYARRACPSPVLRQWQAQRLGVFIHWGISSVAGCGRSVVWFPNLYPPYAWPDLAREFKPPPGVVAGWLRLARRAGMRYAVLTARHHDGYSLFPSAVSEYTVMHSGPQRDLVGEFVSGCRAKGLAVGLYYSLADFSDTGYLAGPEDDPHGWARFLACVNAQLQELLTRYGAVQVLWFDGAVGRGFPWTDPQDWHSDEIVASAKAVQPGILVNNRSGVEGDFFSCEQTYPSSPCRAPWEVAMTMNRSWFHNPGDAQYKSVTDLVRTLATVVSRNGNLLLNLAPDAAGQLAWQEVEALSGIGDWMAVHSEAIHGCGPAPWGLGEIGVTTARPGKIYLHLFTWPGTTLLLPHPETAILSATLVTTGARLHAKRIRGLGWRLSGLPPVPPNPHATVIKLRVP